MTVAVVTGASRGLGLGLVERFLEKGVSVAGFARSEPKLGTLTAGVDVTDAAAVERFAARVEDELGPVDLWVNNAGVLEPMGPLRDLAATDVEHHLRVNVIGVIHGTQAFLRHRAAAATLVNISSGAALKGRAGWAAYCAGKAAVDRITECVQLEEGDAGVRAHAVAPGVIDTGMQEMIRSTLPERFPDVDQFVDRKRRGDFNTPAFVADRLLDLLAQRPRDVVLRLPAEHGQ